MKSYKKKEIKDKSYRCFFELTFLVIGGKWKPIILYKIARDRILRFGELRRQIQGLTERMLSRQLRELENDGLIHREVYKQVPPKVEYSLTELGHSLIPVLLNMREWGVTYETYLGGEALFPGEEYEPREKLEIESVGFGVWPR